MFTENCYSKILHRQSEEKMYELGARLIRELCHNLGITTSEFFELLEQNSQDTISTDAPVENDNVIRQRCNWLLGRLVQSQSSILHFSELDTFKSMFKTAVLTEYQGKLMLTVDKSEVSGATKDLAVTTMVCGFMLYTNLNTLEDFDKVGGALLYKHTTELSNEASKRCDLSPYSLNGSVISTLLRGISTASTLVSCLICMVVMLLVAPDFSKEIRKALLLFVMANRLTAPNSGSTIYNFIMQCGSILKIDFGFLAQDVLYQLKSIGVSDKEPVVGK